MKSAMLKAVMRELGSMTSPAKAKAARANGLRPCREGKKRGRKMGWSKKVDALQP